MPPKLYTINDAAQKTGKAVVTVRMLVRTHGLGQKLGTAYVLTDKDIDALLKIPGPGRPKGPRKKKA
jgi:hypothetical protein